MGEQRPGGRAARVRTGVLDATSELLMDVGYEQLSIEEVAARAGVHKTTVYRRWLTKADLVADAIGVQAAEAVPIPDTGVLLTDLQLLAREVVANIGSEGGARLSRSLVAASASSDELAAAMRVFWGHRLTSSAAIIERAVERGELPRSVEPNVIIEAVVGPIWLRLLLTGEPIDDDFADEIVSLVVAGCRNS